VPGSSPGGPTSASCPSRGDETRPMPFAWLALPSYTRSVARCPACGTELPGEFPFCPFCAAPLRGGSGREQRKTVTVVFCDVIGSTALGGSFGPEQPRGLLAQCTHV